MADYAVIEQATGNVVNRIVLDDPTQWEVPEGHFIVEDTDDAINIGGTYVDGVYTSSPPAPPLDPQPGAPTPTPADQVLYEHENRIRALEGQPPLALGDFIAKVSSG
jgi:hypothetical protein